MNAEGASCTLLSGIESDILADGALDYPDEVLRSLEIVIASSHRRFSLDREKSTARMVQGPRARRAPTCSGIRRGGYLLGRAPLDFDMDAVLEACVKSGCAVELNGSAHRLDFGARELGMAKERGLLVSIAADAHATGEIAEHLEHGIAGRATRRAHAGRCPQRALAAGSARVARGTSRARERLSVCSRARCLGSHAW